MANTGFISMAPQIAAVQTVVDAIRATDVPVLTAGIATIAADTGNIRAVDFPATDALINGIGDLSLEEKSLLGIGMHPGLIEHFNTVADQAAPDATFWTVVENGGGSVKVNNQLAAQPGNCQCQSGAVNGDDALVHSADKFVISMKDIMTTIHLKSYLMVDYQATDADQCGIGFMSNDVAFTQIDDLSVLGNHVATIVVNNDNAQCYSSDGVAAESTNISAYLTDGVLALIEIVISRTDVKYYVNGTLRATHETRVPLSTWQICFGASSKGANQQIYIHRLFISAA